MQVLLQAKHVALPFYSLQTRCLSHPIVLSRLSRPCELNDRFRLCRPRRYLLCAHQFAADSVRVDGGRLAHPKARARPVVKDSFQTVFGMFIRPHREKSGIGKENYPRICDRLPRARILTHLTRFRLILTKHSGESLRRPSGLKPSQQNSRSQPKTRTILVGVVVVGSLVVVARL